MPNPFADTPPNPWNIRISAAAYGAAQLPIPQPATKGEAATVAFRDRLKAAQQAQIEANGDAYAAMASREAAKPYAPPTARAATPVAATPPVLPPPAPASTLPQPAASAARDRASYTPGVPSWPAPGDTLKKPAATAPDFTNWQWPSAQVPADGPSFADHIRAKHGAPPVKAELPAATGAIGHARPCADAMPAPNGQSLTDRMRARHPVAAATPASEPAGTASAKPSLSDHMRARFGLPPEAAGRPTEPTHTPLKTAGR